MAFSGAISTAQDICQIVILLRTLGQPNPIAYDRSSLILSDSQCRQGSSLDNWGAHQNKVQFDSGGRFPPDAV